ncbi:hypothetical protein [Actinoplanes sp. L3-i22]|uniref:hypothetical protein n=1 Tax=Actinoplanes sp. L3-i22 TaxID=2836373 RepID=UPI001C86445D|nr:hypothetical protein [Actinoplanes sp. L3-i22]
MTLLDHARRTPHEPLPDSDVHQDSRNPDGARALWAVLREFVDDPGLSPRDLHERCTRVRFSARNVSRAVRDGVPESSARLLRAARWLVTNGTDRRAVLLGLGLLDGNAGPDDGPVIRTIGLLPFAGRAAAEVLAKIPTAARDLIWLAERSHPSTRHYALTTLAGNADPVVRQWVLSAPRDLLSSALARRIAEQYSLAEALGRADVDDRTWDQAGTLLIAMTSTRNHRYEIHQYGPAVAVYRRWVELAGTRPAMLERAALLASVAEDLCTGPAAPVVGDLRAGLIGRIDAVLASAPWVAAVDRAASSADPVEARRAAWILGRAGGGIPGERFAVRVVVPDPVPDGFPQVEARIVIDGRPIVAAAFDKGPAEQPERLLGGRRLRATVEPREVRLAEAYCTEGCCGGLYVTIVRDGSGVLWKDWRSSMPGDPPPDVRFDAARYDRELARAEQDHGWEWPARTAARRIVERLTADPTVLGRWDCSPGWCHAWLKDFDVVRFTFGYPAGARTLRDPSIQFGQVIEVNGRDPEVVAAEFVESMRDTDPKSLAEMVGGSRDAAGELGLVYRAPSRW